MLRTDNEVLNQTVYQAWQRQIKSPRKAKTFPGDFIIWGVETVTFQTYQMKDAKIRWLASLQKTPNFVAFTELFNHFPRENQECQAIIIGILPYPHIRLFLRSPLQ